MAEIEEGKKYEKIALDCLNQNNLQDAESNFLQALKHMEQSGDEAGQACAGHQPPRSPRPATGRHR